MLNDGAKGSFQPLNLKDNKTVLERIRRFEEELSNELDQTVSVVAYGPQTEIEDLGHS